MTATAAVPLPPAARAGAIYAQARSEIDARLWRAALGADLGGAPAAARVTARPALALDALLSTLGVRYQPAPPVADAGPASPAVAVPAMAETGRPAGLGVNAHYAPSIDEAAARTGVPSAALAAIVDAESAKDRQGRWQTGSRNPRSSAVGLGQFLAGTWQSEAQRAGTWLNEVARSSGWLGRDGTVLSGARAALLALRHDATASINATADYSRLNLDRLKQAGVSIGEDVGQIAHAAYLGHNLGLRDAVSFLSGELGEGRARLLLEAQVGASRAAQRIAAAGGAIAAHREWLTTFIERRVEAARFAA